MDRRIRTKGRLLVLATIGALVHAGGLTAQACLGVPTHDRQGFLTARAAFSDGYWMPGGAIGYDAPGPVAGSVGFDYALYDNTDVGVARVLGQIVLEVPDLPVSICPGFGGGYQWLADDAGTGIDADGVLLAGGVAIGGRLETSSGFAIIPHASGSVVHDRASFRSGTVTATDSETYGMFWTGFVIAAGSVYLGPRVTFFTRSGTDPEFSAELGVVF